MSLKGNGALIDLMGDVPCALAAGLSLLALTLRLGQPVSLRYLLGWLGAGVVVLGASVPAVQFPVPGQPLIDFAAALAITGVLVGAGLVLAATASTLNRRAVLASAEPALLLLIALLPMGAPMGWFLGPPLTALVVALAQMPASRRPTAVYGAWATAWLVAADAALVVGILLGAAA